MGLFDKLESKLEQGVNGAFARAFKAEVQPVEIASGMRRAMDDRASSVKKGQRPVVPNLFTIELSPTDYERLSAWGHELDDELIASAQEHCEEQRYLPGGPLTIVLAEEPELETGVFRLRPATAKAADALAHSRNFPRPEVAAATERDDRSGRSTAGASDRKSATVRPTEEHRDHRASDDKAESPSSDRSGADRPASEGSLGSRIKGYLMGETGSAAGTAAHRPERSIDDDRVHDARRDDARADHAYEDHYRDEEYADDLDAQSEYSEHSDYSSLDDARDRSEYSAPRDDVDDGYDHYAGSSAAQVRETRPRDTRDTDGTRGKAPLKAAPMPKARTPRPTPERRERPDAAREPARPQQRSQEHAAPSREQRHEEQTAHIASPAPAAPARSRGESPRQRPWLKIDGQRYPLLGAITTLGRDDDADIVIDDPGVSRQHCEIRVTHDGPHLVMSIRDLGSTNGTFVNGDRVDSQHVRDGDRLTVGRTHMTIHLGDRA